ncbi:hydroxymethylbilane synthase [Gammaproteobacteria bacterium]|nr:hydroxymethylbilane synthase [Gammaproteobacteria bacterium]MDC3279268.1 hydroxymethylbilane synthase [Gammaproteobacteria bacterium]
MTLIKIGTRQSDLAMWQARFVKNSLIKHHRHLDVELVGITTEGDRTLDVPLSEKGGKGLFLKELEKALLDRSVDIAVHSMKDVTIHDPDGLHIPVICERASPFDVFVSTHYENLESLPKNARVGTCSLRRQSILRHRFPDLEVENLRGNVNRRLQRLDNGDFDAIILAAAGLHRLDMADRIRQVIAPEVMLPAVGQGAVGIQCRKDDKQTTELIRPLNHLETQRCVQAERAANARLGGGCHVPVGAFAGLENGLLELRGFVGDPDGSQLIFADVQGAKDAPNQIGYALAEKLLAQGAGHILNIFRDA